LTASILLTAYTGRDFMATFRENTLPLGDLPEDLPLRELFDGQREAFRVGPPDYRKRLNSLDLLRRTVLGRQDEIARATDADFGGRARQETLLLELAPLVDSIRHATRHLASWMKPRRVRAGIHFFPATTRIIYQPLGVVGIIGAWNYPTLLTLLQLVDAIAAGNHVMLKPSEIAPRTAELLGQIIASIFPREYIAVVTGDERTAAAFASLPFDHLLFTGSTRVGKLIMRSASDHLTPVTLELGGKCPAIIHPEFPLRTAVGRIMAGKLYNAGQTCLAPDYVFAHESQRDAFVECAREVVKTLYPTWAENFDYTRIINRAHYDRLARYVDHAAARGARVIPLGENTEGCTSTNRVFPPVALLDVDDTMQVMQEEIFGPILPILTYRHLDDALKYVNDRPHPLAIYYFDHDARRVDHLLKSTRSGGVTINDVIYHIAQNNLPFGGVGASGIGQYRGHAGFKTFSKQKGVMMQSRFTSLRFLRPPYGELAERAIRFLLRK
jgi:coniferyl-aldehyde dehydrogenase